MCIWITCCVFYIAWSIAVCKPVFNCVPWLQAINCVSCFISWLSHSYVLLSTTIYWIMNVCPLWIIYISCCRTVSCIIHSHTTSRRIWRWTIIAAVSCISCISTASCIATLALIHIVWRRTVVWRIILIYTNIVNLHFLWKCTVINWEARPISSNCHI